MKKREEIHIGVNALSQNQGGGITYTTKLLSELATLNPNWKFSVFATNPSLRNFEFPQNVTTVFVAGTQPIIRRFIWENFSLQNQLHDRKVDLLISLGGYIPFFLTIPNISVWQNANVWTNVQFPRTVAFKTYLRLQRIMQSFSMPRAKMNIFLTQDSLQEVSSRWNLSKISHSVIHSGFDLPASVAMRSIPDHSKEYHLLAIGHTYYHKNYETMIDAIKCYIDKYPEKITLRIAGGPYNKKYHQEIIDRIQELEIDNHIIMLGSVESKQIPSLYHEADIYLCLTVLESFSLTILESMGYGCPVLLSNATCNPEVAGGAALLCCPKDPHQVADQIHRLITNPELRRELRKKGLYRAREFTWRKTAEQYTREINSILNSENE